MWCNVSSEGWGWGDGCSRESKGGGRAYAGIHSVDDPDSLGEEAVEQPSSLSSDAPVSLPRWQEMEQTVEGVLYYAGSSAGAVYVCVCV